MHYCEAVLKMPVDSPHIHYHLKEYGFPIYDDNELFGRLLLEINQAGLSWTTILNKQDNFRKAYSNFKISEVAGYGDNDFERLMANPGIIRNKLKIEAAIYNAGIILKLQADSGSFLKWLENHQSKSKEEWIKLFRKTFRFTGGEIVNEFLMSIGFLPGAHLPECPVYEACKLKGAVHFKQQIRPPGPSDANA